MKILMVEDDKAIVDVIKDAMKGQYIVDHAQSIAEATQKLKQEHYHLVLLDIQLPDGNGLDYIQTIRSSSEIPIIFLSVVSDNHLIARGLDYGADDYVTKPFSLRVLLSRINSVMRRYEIKKSTFKQYGDICLDFQRQQVYRHGELVSLTPVESQLLYTLVNGHGRILTRRYLLESIWDDRGSFVEDNTLSVHIRRLKSKIGDGYIKTKRNVGYYFAGDDDE